MYNFFSEIKDHGLFGYTDLACERREADKRLPGIEYKSSSCPVGTWEHVKVKDDTAAKAIGRPCGIYSTLNLTRLDLLDDEDISDAVEELAKRLCIICDDISVMPARILVVGFGNEALTADSVGPKAAIAVKPTLHIREYDEALFDSLECSEIAVIRPDVTMHTGLDSFTVVKTTCEEISPDVIIAIDSIMTHSKERLGSTVQISDTGIFPGGIGNLKQAISRSTLGVPVIGIGVPTVMDLRCISKDPLENSNSTLYVSPREIDEVTDSAARIISGSINQAFGFCY